MDVKTNAELVNSIASGESIACPQCGKANKAGGKFCVACGTKLPAPVMEEVKVVAEEAKAVEEVEVTAEEVKVVEEVKAEPKAGTAFASLDEKETETDEKPAEPEVKPIENVPEKPQSAPAFATVDDAKPAEPAAVEEKKTEAVKVAPAIVYEEPESVFAQGLPEWSIEPPQVVVRRKR